MKKLYVVFCFFILIASSAGAQSGSWLLTETRGCLPFAPLPCPTDEFRIDSNGVYSHSLGGSGHITADEASSLNSAVQPFLAGVQGASPGPTQCISTPGGPPRYAQDFSISLQGQAPAPMASASPSPSPSPSPISSSGQPVFSSGSGGICAVNGDYTDGNALFNQVQALGTKYPAQPSPSPSASASPSS